MSCCLITFFHLSWPGDAGWPITQLLLRHQISDCEIFRAGDPKCLTLTALPQAQIFNSSTGQHSHFNDFHAFRLIQLIRHFFSFMTSKSMSCHVYTAYTSVSVFPVNMQACLHRRPWVSNAQDASFTSKNSS
jgi:hypothetical protein